MTTAQEGSQLATQDRDTGLAPPRHDPSLLDAVRQAIPGTPARRFLAGLRLPLVALGFLRRHRELWPSVAWPALINVCLFAGFVWGFLALEGSLVDAIWAKPLVEQWYHYLVLGLWYVFQFIAIVATIAAAYIVTLVVGAVAASPFNDILSERTEKLLLGVEEVDKLQRPLWKEILSSAISTGTVSLIYLGLLAPLLFLHLIPGVGSVAYAVAAGVLGSYFLALEYSDIFMQRRGYPMTVKFNTIWRERTLTCGFGLGTSLLLWIPLLNFICAPLAVVTGTALGLGLHLDRPPVALPSDDDGA